MYGAQAAPRQPLRAPATSATTYRDRCADLALDHDTAATYTGRVTGGDDLYTAPSASQPGRIHQISHRRNPARDRFPADGAWTCDCRAGELGRACRHVGAAMLLAARRAELTDAIEAAKLAGLGARDCRRAGSRWDGVSFWLVDDSVTRRWLRVRVTFDPRPGRGVGETCSCGQLACAHLGAVALRYAEPVRTDASDLFGLYD